MQTNNQMEYIQKLTELQNIIGYVSGDISPVAILGFMGEVGEVAAEMTFKTTEPRYEYGGKLCSDLIGLKLDLAQSSSRLDTIKKMVRNDPSLNISVQILDEAKFDMELADQFYYLNALAIERGLSLDDLARMSYEKVIGKQATVGGETLGK